MPHSVIARLLRCRTVEGPPLKARLPMHTPFHAGHRLPPQPVPLGGSVWACCGTASCPILRTHVRAGGHRQQCVRGSLCAAGLQNRADRAAEKGGRVARRPAPGEPSYGRGGAGPFRMQQAAASGRAPISAHGTRMSHPHSICIRPRRGLSQTAKCHGAARLPRTRLVLRRRWRTRCMLHVIFRARLALRRRTRLQPCSVLPKDTGRTPFSSLG